MEIGWFSGQENENKTDKSRSQKEENQLIIFSDYLGSNSTDQ